MIFLPHTNTVILLEPYCGTITEPGLPVCDADYVGYTARHLHQRIAEHKNSAIGRHFLEAHGNNNLLRESQFTVLRKCQSKFDCLVFEMLFIKKLKPNLNIQTDSIRAKLFV